MKPYSVLTKLAPEAYLVPDNFRTDFDGINSKYADEQYQHGLEIGQQAEQVVIACNGTWGARLKTGGHVSSCEGIGYHSQTAALLRGFLDSGAAIIVYRYDRKEGVRIK